MAEYIDARIALLKTLRIRFAEKGFLIFSILKRYSKNEQEFIAVKPGDYVFGSVIIRLFYSNVRIQFFEVKNPWHKELREYITMGWENHICFAAKSLNSRRDDPSRFWFELVPVKELKEVYSTQELKKLRRIRS